MPKVNNLPLDSNIVSGDKILVTDQNNAFATKLMTLDQLAVYLAKTGNADPGRDAFLYEIKNDITGSGQAELLSNNSAASTLAQITVSRVDSNGVDRLPLYQFLETSTIKISVVDTIKDANYAVYSVDSIAQVGTDEIRIFLSHQHGPSTAKFAVGNTIAITPMAHGGNVAVNISQLRHGEGAPDATLGNSGDFYIDTENIEIYGPKLAGDWGSPTDLVQAPNVGTVDVTLVNNDSAASVEIVKDGNQLDYHFYIPRGHQGIGISSISGTTPAAGEATIVTVGYSDPSGETPPDDDTFIVAAGVQGYQGIGVTSAESNVDDIALGDDTTVTLTLTDPSDNSTTTTTFDVKAGQKGDPFLDVEEGDTTISGATTLRVVGTNVSLAADGDDPSTAVLTFHGGGGGISDPVFNALTYSGFTQDQFPNVNQTVTTNQTLTANDATITSVQFVSTNNDADDFDVTDSTSPYSSGAQTVRAGATNGSSVTVTSTITYNLPGEDSTTATRTHAFTPQRTTKPGREAFLSSPSSFNYTPAGNKIEAYDAGSFTVKSDYDTTDNNGWDVGTISYNHTVSSNSVSVTSGTSDFDFNATATITQASTPDTSGGDDDKISETGYQVNNDATYDRIRSVRIGGTTNSSFTATEIQTLSSWGDDLKFRTESPNGQTFTVSTTAGEKIYILYDASLGDITKIVDGNNNTVTNQYTKGTDVSGMKFYLQNVAGAALTDYELTITL